MEFWWRHVSIVKGKSWVNFGRVPSDINQPVPTYIYIWVYIYNGCFWGKMGGNIWGTTATGYPFLRVRKISLWHKSQHNDPLIEVWCWTPKTGYCMLLLNWMSIVTIYLPPMMLPDAGTSIDGYVWWVRRAESSTNIPTKLDEQWAKLNGNGWFWHEGFKWLCQHMENRTNMNKPLSKQSYYSTSLAECLHCLEYRWYEIDCTTSFEHVISHKPLNERQVSSTYSHGAL